MDTLQELYYYGTPLYLMIPLTLLVLSPVVIIIISLVQEIRNKPYDHYDK